MAKALFSEQGFCIFEAAGFSVFNAWLVLHFLQLGFI
jgi:hypothetical protein